MATTTIAEIAPVATANGWTGPTEQPVAGIDGRPTNGVWQFNFTRGTVVVKALVKHNVVIDAARVDEANNTFTLVGETAPSADFVLQWLEAK